ncbi:MAG: mechanosensitive ion channel family protein [Alphaproteobacteria bacterium]|nr:mechanosensitive ion channel family protein [Alphaproteobacteria bacterium]MBT5390569.1 mechanosensitive ion channel family protein [Alphaproteobacteria bacterium]MBT5540928.1 mechanosensitive ion channel family protein [Alphaproteobacteria bacterium]
MEKVIQHIGEWMQSHSFYFFGIDIMGIVLPLLVFSFFILLRKLFAVVVLKLLRRKIHKLNLEGVDDLVRALEAPLKFLFVIIGLFCFLELMKLQGLFVKLDNRGIVTLTAFTFFWALFRLPKPVLDLLDKHSNLFDKSSLFDLKSLFFHIWKSFIVIVGLILILDVWDYNVTAFVASLGIAGAAVALAAKDTVSNYFGSLVIYLDRTYKKGDWIKTSGTEGIVEFVGMRSTKIRTFDKALVTVPNSVVANDTITNWSKMPCRRVNTTIGVEYGTTKKQIETIIKKIRKYLFSNPDVRTEGVLTIINFQGFAASSLDIRISFFIKTVKRAEFMQVQEDCLLAIKGIVEGDGVKFAFPSQSIYVESLPEAMSKKQGK